MAGGNSMIWGSRGPPKRRPDAMNGTFVDGFHETWPMITAARLPPRPAASTRPC